MTTAAKGVTKPDAGVIATKPATAPEAAPSIVGLPVFIHSAIIQPNAANEAAVCVAINALDARPFAPRADPALNPNQPTQSIAAPTTANGKLWGAIGILPKPTRLPMINTATSAETPALICTTVPPAKSSAPILRKNPPTPQTQCARGSYINVTHSSEKTRKVENFIRS